MRAGPKLAAPGGLDRRSPAGDGLCLEWLSLLITRVAKFTTFGNLL